MQNFTLLRRDRAVIETKRGSQLNDTSILIPPTYLSLQRVQKCGDCTERTP